jgi:hypothetical protein
VVVQAGSVLITSRLREFHLQVIDVILAPQLCELTEEDGSDFDSLACNHCSFAAGRRGVQFSEEYVPLGVGLFLGGSVLASAGTDGMEFPGGLDRSVRQQFVMPVAEEPIAPGGYLCFRASFKSSHIN